MLKKNNTTPNNVLRDKKAAELKIVSKRLLVANLLYSYVKLFSVTATPSATSPTVVLRGWPRLLTAPNSATS